MIYALHSAVQRRMRRVSIFDRIDRYELFQCFSRTFKLTYSVFKVSQRPPSIYPSFDDQYQVAALWWRDVGTPREHLTPSTTALILVMSLNGSMVASTCAFTTYDAAV